MLFDLMDFVTSWFQLAPDDAWKCPHCKQLQQGMVKMSLWTLPDILILHLKRFRQVGGFYGASVEVWLLKIRTGK